jgi:hypothetical protein
MKSVAASFAIAGSDSRNEAKAGTNTGVILHDGVGVDTPLVAK